MKGLLATNKHSLSKRQWKRATALFDVVKQSSREPSNDPEILMAQQYEQPVMPFKRVTEIKDAVTRRLQRSIATEDWVRFDRTWRRLE